MNRFSLSLVSVFTLLWVMSSVSAAQRINSWSPAQQIPNYHPETNPPLMVVDQNRTVHAFSSQWFDEEERPLKTIVYNNWRVDQGWSRPVDILLSPNKNEARITGVYLDPKDNTVHLTFFGGDGTEANIYYASAKLPEAYNASSWSKPIMVGAAAGDPEVSVIMGNSQGQLVIAYSGTRQGNGLYTTYSDDGGETWTNAQPFFLTYSRNFPYALSLFPGESGLIHAIWDVRDVGGNGRQIVYSSLDFENRRWQNPVVLQEVDEGYGILNPAIVEYDSEIFVAYSGIYITRSRDGGRTWSDPVKPFIHTGVNGVVSFVVDSNNFLHLLWAQRISGNPDIHGVWHSIWENGRWSEPEAVVSGPQIPDQIGANAFDPYDVRAVISQGNILLATWRSDPGLRGNGVWFSYITLDSPELPVQIPVTTSMDALDQALVEEYVQGISSTQIAEILPNVNAVEFDEKRGGLSFTNPAGFVLVGLFPVAIFILVIFMGNFYRTHFRR